MKKAGLDLPDSTKTAPENLTASYVITGHLVAALRGQEEIRTSDNSAYLQDGRAELQNQSVLRADEALVETLLGGLSKIHTTCYRRQIRGHG